MKRDSLRWSSLLHTALIGLLLWMTQGQVLIAQEGVVRFYIFYGETCPHCHEVMENYLPTVYEKYGDKVEHQAIDVWSNTDNYLLLLGLETKLGVPQERQGAVPVLVIGDKVLIGALEIPEKLETYVDEYLAQGGVDYPSLENLPPVVLPTAQPAVQILLFFDPASPEVQRLRSFLSTLGQQYGSGLEAYAVDITQADTADRLAELNAAFGLDNPEPGTPEILVGRQILVGNQEIEERLPGLIEAYLAEGGSNIPPWEELVGGGPEETPTTASPTATPAPLPIYVAYFEQAGCQECARTTYDLRLVQDQYSQVVVESFSMEDRESQVLNEWLCERYGVPAQKRLSTPMIFLGQDVIIGEEATLQSLLSLASKYARTGAERTWDEFDPAQAEQSLIDRFRSFGVLTVVGAGLIDGLNPCAFATLVFFVSYLAFTGRRGRDILLVGVAFALGVFLTYLLVGVGLLKVVQSLSFFTALGRWVYLLTALLCTTLAGLTFRDYYRARRGEASEMTLKLPLSLRRRIHRVIREGSQMRAFVAVAFFTGFVVSLLELACTGQVYLPTIMFVMSVPELAAKAVLYLVLYCLMFILPLIVVFSLSYLGTTSEQLGDFVQRHTASIKLATGLLFVGLALWMTWTLAPLFGASEPWNWLLMGGNLVSIALIAAVLQRADQHATKKQVARRGRSRA